MKVVIQRVSQASVVVDNQMIGQIEKGFMLLVSVEDADTQEDLDWIVKKTIGIRIFNDKNGKMNLSINEVDGSLLVISQFTLHASVKKGNRPSFIKAGAPEFAKKRYQDLIESFKIQLISNQVKSGEFGADMKVSLINDGPVTILLDSKNKI